MSSTAQLIADLFFIRDIGLIMYECYTIKQLVIPKKLDLSRLIKNMLQEMQLLCH